MTRVCVINAILSLTTTSNHITSLPIHYPPSPTHPTPSNTYSHLTVATQLPLKTTTLFNTSSVLTKTSKVCSLLTQLLPLFLHLRLHLRFLSLYANTPFSASHFNLNSHCSTLLPHSKSLPHHPTTTTLSLIQSFNGPHQGGKLVSSSHLLLLFHRIQASAIFEDWMIKFDCLIWCETIGPYNPIALGFPSRLLSLPSTSSLTFDTESSTYLITIAHSTSTLAPLDLSIHFHLWHLNLNSQFTTSSTPAQICRSISTLLTRNKVLCFKVTIQ